MAHQMQTRHDFERFLSFELSRGLCYNPDMSNVRYTIPTWLLVIVLFCSGVLSLFDVWLTLTMGLPDEPDVRFIHLTVMFMFALPAWFAVGMLIQRWLRKPPNSDGPGWYREP